ncbi:MAG: hypothetical protein ACJ76P_10500 [Actinomycetota bacterium]
MGWLLLGLALIAGVVVLGFARARRRTAALRMMGTQFGLSYSPVVPMEARVLPLPLLSQGDKQRFRNLLAGRWGGIDLQEFDLAIVKEEGRSSSTTWYSCAVTSVPAWCRTISIHTESAIARAADRVLEHQVPFESEQFQRAFKVDCGDERFATAFVDPRMMSWLLAHGRGWTFEVAGCWALCYRKLVDPEELIPLLGTLRGFTDHIPRVVSELYGVDGAR